MEPIGMENMFLTNKNMPEQPAPNSTHNLMSFCKNSN
jgi:hypothetical protein